MILFPFQFLEPVQVKMYSNYNIVTVLSLFRFTSITSISSGAGRVARMIWRIGKQKGT